MTTARIAGIYVLAYSVLLILIDIIAYIANGLWAPTKISMLLLLLMIISGIFIIKNKTWAKIISILLFVIWGMVGLFFLLKITNLPISFMIECILIVITSFVGVIIISKTINLKKNRVICPRCNGSDISKDDVNLTSNEAFYSYMCNKCKIHFVPQAGKHNKKSTVSNQIKKSSKKKR